MEQDKQIKEGSLVEVVQSSVLGRLLLPMWLWLRERYEYSLLARVLRSIAQGWSRACAGSVLVNVLTREGCLSRAWKDSIFCHVLTFLLSIPTILLQKLYGALRDVFEGSLASQIVFAVVENTPLVVGWLMVLFLAIPYESWSNGYSFVGFVLCFLLAIAAGMRKKNFRLDMAFLGPWVAAFFGMILVSWPLSAYPALSTRFLALYLTCILCVIVVVSTVENGRHLRRLLSFTSLSLLIMSLYGIYQRIQGVEVNPSYVDMDLNEGMPGRVFGFFENPNAFAEVLLLLIPVAIAYMLCAKSWGGRFLGLVSAGVGCVSIAMTYSRASWVGLVFAAAIFVVLWNRKLIPLGILAALVVLAALPETVFNRVLTIFNTSDSSTTSRFPLYRAAGEFLKQRPVLGAGLGTDAVRQAVSDLNLFHGKDHFVHCHNIYLQVWCETGLVGLISFVGGILWTFKQGCRSVAQGTCGPVARMTIIGSVAGLMGTMLCGVADYIWNYPRVMLIFWFVCALALAGIRLAAQGEEEQVCDLTTGV